MQSMVAALKEVKPFLMWNKQTQDVRQMQVEQLKEDIVNERLGIEALESWIDLTDDKDLLESYFYQLTALEKQYYYTLKKVRSLSY